MRIFPFLLFLHLLCGCQILTFEEALQKTVERQTVTQMATNVWLTIKGQNITYEEAWQKIVSTIGEKYEIEVLESDAGYLRTAWRSRSFLIKYGLMKEEKKQVQFRSRIVVRCISKQETTFKIQVATQQNVGGSWQDFDRIFKDDLTLVQEIRALLTRQ